VPRVLVITPNFEDYLADGLIHGLRELLGADCVEFPKAEYLYDTASPAVLGRVRGGGFTLYGRLPDLPIDRDHLLQRALGGEFDLVVFGDIWRSFGLWAEWGIQLHAAGIPLAVLDGSDRVEPYPYAGLWWRVRAWWFLPRAHTRAPYFKREITRWTGWFRSYLTLPPPLARRTVAWARPIGFSIPAGQVVDPAAPAQKSREFPSHIVDPDVAPRVGGRTSYAFADEAAYVADLRASRYGITTRREGWDALRHYEIAAAGAVPCFRDLHRKPPGCAPHGLVPGVNCLAYRSADDLLGQVRRIDEAAYARLRAGTLAWVADHTTRAAAQRLLGQLGIALG
jgi:hypothetical protein